MLTYGQIDRFLRDQRLADADPEHAALMAVDWIGARRMREALTVLLTMHARCLPTGTEEAERRAERARQRQAEDERAARRADASKRERERERAERSETMERALRRRKETQARNMQRAAEGLPPLRRDRYGNLYDPQKERERREKACREIDEAGGLIGWIAQEAKNFAEEYAKEAYGDKIWTGSEWVAIWTATREELTGAIAFHEAETEHHASEAKYHRKQAERLRRLLAVLPEDGRVQDVEPMVLQALATAAPQLERTADSLYRIRPERTAA